MSCTNFCHTCLPTSYEGVETMKCPKCEGLMTVDRFADYFLTFSAWKCINCGAVMDQTILSNKHSQGEWELMSEMALSQGTEDK